VRLEKAADEIEAEIAELDKAIADLRDLKAQIIAATARVAAIMDALS
jgi:hypothetical protein